MADTTDNRDDEAQRISVIMLASAGLTPRDISTALNVSELQIRRWLKQVPDDEPPEAA